MFLIFFLPTTMRQASARLLNYSYLLFALFLAMPPVAIINKKRAYIATSPEDVKAKILGLSSASLALSPSDI
jgi:hypothetical protein